MVRVAIRIHSFSLHSTGPNYRDINILLDLWTTIGELEAKIHDKMRSKCKPSRSMEKCWKMVMTERGVKSVVSDRARF